MYKYIHTFSILRVQIEAEREKANEGGVGVTLFRKTIER